MCLASIIRLLTAYFQTHTFTFASWPHAYSSRMSHSASDYLVLWLRSDLQNRLKAFTMDAGTYSQMVFQVGLVKHSRQLSWAWLGFTDCEKFDDHLPDDFPHLLNFYCTLTIMFLWNLTNRTASPSSRCAEAINTNVVFATMTLTPRCSKSYLYGN